MKIPMIIVLAILVSLAATTLTSAIMAYGVRKDKFFFRIFILQFAVGAVSILFFIYARVIGG